MPSVTAGVIRNKVQIAMGDLTKTFIEDIDVYGWIFDACQEIAKLTECVTGDTIISTVPYTEQYALDNAFLRILRVTYQGRKLGKTTINELDTIDPNRDVTGNSGIPTHYFIEGGYVGLWRKPSEGTVNGLKLTARILPTVPIDSDEDIIGIPDLFQQNITQYCILQARHKDEAPEMIMVLIEDWKTKVAQAKNIIDNPESSYASVTDIESMADYSGNWYN